MSIQSNNILLLPANFTSQEDTLKKENQQIIKNINEISNQYRTALTEIQQRAFDQSPYLQQKNFQSIVQKLADQYQKLRKKHNRELMIIANQSFNRQISSQNGNGNNLHYSNNVSPNVNIPGSNVNNNTITNNANTQSYNNFNINNNSNNGTTHLIQNSNNSFNDSRLAPNSQKLQNNSGKTNFNQNVKNFNHNNSNASAFIASINGIKYKEDEEQYQNINNYNNNNLGNFSVSRDFYDPGHDSDGEQNLKNQRASQAAQRHKPLIYNNFSSLSNTPKNLNFQITQNGTILIKHQKFSQTNDVNHQNQSIFIDLPQPSSSAIPQSYTMDSNIPNLPNIQKNHPKQYKLRVSSQDKAMKKIHQDLSPPRMMTSEDQYINITEIKNKQVKSKAKPDDYRLKINKFIDVNILDQQPHNNQLNTLLDNSNQFRTPRNSNQKSTVLTRRKRQIPQSNNNNAISTNENLNSIANTSTNYIQLSHLSSNVNNLQQEGETKKRDRYASSNIEKRIQNRFKDGQDQALSAMDSNTNRSILQNQFILKREKPKLNRDDNCEEKSGRELDYNETLVNNQYYGNIENSEKKRSQLKNQQSHGIQERIERIMKFDCKSHFKDIQNIIISSQYQNQYRIKKKRKDILRNYPHLANEFKEHQQVHFQINEN